MATPEYSPPGSPVGNSADAMDVMERTGVDLVTPDLEFLEVPLTGPPGPLKECDIVRDLTTPDDPCDDLDVTIVVCDLPHETGIYLSWCIP